MTVCYTINKSVVYNPADGNLQHTESGDIITLPLPAQRLLQILLDSEGNLISRDYLLEKTWDQYGLNGSGNNLNQYLSIIRRSFSQMGCDAFIETIPRVGVRLFESVVITREADVSTHSPARKQKKRVLSGKDYLLPSSFMMSMAGASVLALLLWGFISFTHDNPDPSYVTQPMEGGCQLVTFFDLTSKDLASARQLVSEYLKTSGKTCEPGLAVYFDNISSRNLGEHVRTLISLCDRNNKEEDAACSNTYYINGVVDER
ncbi:TPA: winged helix-turn-helix domain-containing protein [Enterobacter hormaechei]|nr:winged helix-turn-helix domain-containing protein [Enterobacter hormaechei]